MFNCVYFKSFKIKLVRSPINAAILALYLLPAVMTRLPPFGLYDFTMRYHKNFIILYKNTVHYYITLTLLTLYINNSKLNKNFFLNNTKLNID